MLKKIKIALAFVIGALSLVSVTCVSLATQQNPDVCVEDELTNKIADRNGDPDEGVVLV